MRIERIRKSLARLAGIFTLLVLASPQTLAHCDTMNGPVVKAARAALKARNINLMLIWVQKESENEVKQAFRQTLKVRKLNHDARELADKFFFETVVRIHRAGEGEPYTGLKPAGTEVEPVIALADKALETGSLDPLLKLFPESAHTEIKGRFTDAVAKKNFSPNNVPAGRQYVAAYVSFLHFLEHLHAERAE